MTVLLIDSYAGPSLEHFTIDPRVRMVAERALGAADFDAARGLITTMHLDQVGLMAYRPAIERLLARGGRWFFNGHILCPLLDGLRDYQPLQKPRRSDLVLTRLNPHPIFDGIEQRVLEEEMGVAGFYGRGHNPMPEGALAVNGIGPRQFAIDWDWALPGGGRFFSHAGNDLGGPDGAPEGPRAVPASRIIAWCGGEI
jgi:hypothetical protein